VSQPCSVPSPRSRPWGDGPRAKLEGARAAALQRDELGLALKPAFAAVPQLSWCWWQRGFELTPVGA